MTAWKRIEDLEEDGKSARKDEGKGPRRMTAHGTCQWLRKAGRRRAWGVKTRSRSGGVETVRGTSKKTARKDNGKAPGRMTAGKETGMAARKTTACQET